MVAAHSVPVHKALDIARGKDEMFEVLQRNGKFMPKKTSALATNEYLRNVLLGTIWTPHQDAVRIKNCPQPPTMLVIVDKLIAAATLQNLDLGIIPKRKNHPDQGWALIVLATLSPNDEIFARAYVPPIVKRNSAKLQDVSMPQEGMFDGLENIFDNKRRNKKGTISQLMSRDDVMERKLQQK